MFFLNIKIKESQRFNDIHPFADWFITSADEGGRVDDFSSAPVRGKSCGVGAWSIQYIHNPSPNYCCLRREGGRGGEVYKNVPYQSPPPPSRGPAHY